MKGNIFEVSEEIILITGASGNLGKIYSMALLELNAKVIGIDIFKNSFIDTLLSKYPGKYYFFETDITQKEYVLALKEKIVNQIGIPTVLINNAAIDSPPSAPIEENGPFEDYPLDSWNKVMDVNLTGSLLCAQVFGAVMADRKNGSIINISSIYGLVSPDQSIYEYRRERGETFYKPVAYAVSKAGILNFTRYLATYWAKDGVRVNTLTLAGLYNNQETAFLESYCNRIPIGRMATPDDYIGAIIFLASSASRYMTGSNLVIDGGWTAI